MYFSSQRQVIIFWCGILYLAFYSILNKNFQKITKMFAVKLFDGKHFLPYNKQCFGKEA